MKLINLARVAALLAISAAANAALIYDNGAPDLAHADDEMTHWIQVEDFRLTAATLISDVHFWSLETTFSGLIEYAFYSDIGMSHHNPDVEGFTVAGDLVRTATGRSAFGLNEFSYSFNVTPFVAEAGVTYWLGLKNGTLRNTLDMGMFWETAANNSTMNGQEDIFPFGLNPWNDTGWQHAFQLTGSAVAIPEPASLALLVVGLVGLVASRRNH